MTTPARRISGGVSVMRYEMTRRGRSVVLRIVESVLRILDQYEEWMVRARKLHVIAALTFRRRYTRTTIIASPNEKLMAEMTIFITVAICPTDRFDTMCTDIAL